MGSGGRNLVARPLLQTEKSPIRSIPVFRWKASSDHKNCHSHPTNKKSSNHEKILNGMPAFLLWIGNERMAPDSDYRNWVRSLTALCHFLCIAILANYIGHFLLSVYFKPLQHGLKGLSSARVICQHSTFCGHRIVDHCCGQQFLPPPFATELMVQWQGGGRLLNLLIMKDNCFSYRAH